MEKIHWPFHINKKITWEPLTSIAENKAAKQEYFAYPQDLKIEFSNANNIFISAAAFTNGNYNEVYGIADNLLVTDNEALAKKLNIIS